MAEGLWLMITADTNFNQPHTIDGVTAILINEDEGSSIDQLMLTINQQMVLSGKSILPDTYFNQAIFIGDLTTGPLSDDQACYIFASGGKEIIYRGPINP